MCSICYSIEQQEKTRRDFVCSFCEYQATSEMVDGTRYCNLHLAYYNLKTRSKSDFKKYSTSWVNKIVKEQKRRDDFEARLNVSPEELYNRIKDLPFLKKEVHDKYKK